MPVLSAGVSGEGWQWKDIQLCGVEEPSGSLGQNPVGGACLGTNWRQVFLLPEDWRILKQGREVSPEVRAWSNFLAGVGMKGEGVQDVHWFFISVWNLGQSTCEVSKPPDIPADVVCVCVYIVF